MHFSDQKGLNDVIRLFEDHQMKFLEPLKKRMRKHPSRSLGCTSISRRSVIKNLTALSLSLITTDLLGAQRLTDLEGFDPIWRDAEHALNQFFGPVNFEDSGINIDLPDFAEVGSSVPLELYIPCGMTENDYPEVVHFLAHGNPTPHVFSAWFTPECGRAALSTRIRLEQSQKITVAAKMADGRYIRVDKFIEVSLGACAQVGTGDNDDVAKFKPDTKVSVESNVERGKIIPVRAMISHPMETGMRKSLKDDELIYERFVHYFECKFNEEIFFKMRTYPAISTNPYFKFYLKPTISSSVDFKWVDSFDLIYRNQVDINII